MERTNAGCLLIDDPFFEDYAVGKLRSALTDSGLQTEAFSDFDGNDLHGRLQRAYQRVRRDDALNALVGFGAGCDCALALAGQLPADRLVLIDPADWEAGGDTARQLRRIRRYALRGAAFCAAPALIAPGPRTPEALLRRLCRALAFGGAQVAKPVAGRETARKDSFNSAILHFLRHGVLPKCLAENPEMCIIYG